MLRQILSEYFVPEIIIEEDSEIADVEREKFLKRIEGNPLAPPIRDQVSELNTEVVSVSIHNSDQVMPLIKDRELDLIVFGGTRIIRGNILDFPKDGVINSHPGLLPECRGSASPAWSRPCGGAAGKGQTRRSGAQGPAPRLRRLSGFNAGDSPKGRSPRLAAVSLTSQVRKPFMLK